jgi:hypothetical protein
MPKKSAGPRHGAQRNKPKVKKNFELVRPERVETEESSTTSAKVAIAAQEESGTSSSAADGRGQAPSLREESRTSGRASTAERRGQAPPQREEAETKTEERQNTPAAGSATSLLAAQRQAAQKLQQRSAGTLITSEHFAYVRKDLIKIAVFAVLMFTAIIVLYFTLGRA